MGKPSHDVNLVKTRSYRFSGYKLNRDHDNNIIQPPSGDPMLEPERWKTRSISTRDTYGRGGNVQIQSGDIRK